jgi:exodeoxyribonuclease V
MKKEDIQLTKSQSELIPKMEAFLNSEERIFLLTGKPGVGKTTMTKMVLAEHISADRHSGNSQNMNVAGICLAHQAKNVLGAHIPNVFTFAKAYGLKETINKMTGKRSFTYDKYAQNIIGQQNIPVFVHDEVSQYTEEMLDIVLQRTPIFSKIIFIGDRAQLPPIDPENKMGADSDSPIFRYDLPDSCKHELDERVRQAANNPILELSDIIREEIFGLQRLDRVLEAAMTPNMVNGIGHGIVKEEDLLSHIEKENILNTRLVAFRNMAINKFNPEIRDYVLDSPKDELVDGDVVAMTENFYQENSEGRVDYVLHNSDVLKLYNVYTKVMKFYVAGKSYSIDAYVANIEGRPDKDKFITPTPEGRLVFAKALNEVAKKCKERKADWDEFWQFNKNSFCEYQYAYAITAYKSQGSTYDRIYLDIHDILNTKPISRKRKLQTIYTAITRAKNDVYFITN